MMKPWLERSFSNEYHRTFVGGALATAFLVPIIVPVEYFKVQAQGWEGPTKFSLSNRVKQVYRRQGFRGFYCGGLATVTYQVPGSGFLMGFKHLFETQMNVENETS